MLAALLLALLGGAQAAVPTTTPEAGDRRVLSTVGAEPHAVVGLGYLHALSLGDRVVGLTGVVTLPVFLLDGHHHRVELAARTTVLQRGRLRLDLEAGASEQTTQSALVRGTGLGLSGAAVAGYFGPRAFGAVAVSAGWTPTAHLAPTAHYDALWGGMETGWYASTAARVGAAVQGGVTVGDRVELTLQLGVEESLRGEGRLAPLAGGLGVHLWL